MRESISLQKHAKFGIGIGIIVISMGLLAWLGYGESKTYYHTIAELQTLQGADRGHRLRVAGTVEPGTIRRMFVDKSQALVEGNLARNGSFVAEHVQAKCASKYEAAPNAGSTSRVGGDTSRSVM